MPRYQLAVLGAGATGLGAARAAARAGRSVALIEPGRPGGDCTHYGCVPSKALLETSRRIAAAHSGDRYGFHGTVEVDFAAVMKRLAAVISEVEDDESPALLARQQIDLLVGRARFTDAHTLTLDSGTTVSADRFVIASGASALIPPIPGLADLPYLTNRSVFSLAAPPRRLVVLGGGPVGCELAQAFARLGVPVTLVEALPRLLNREEPEAGRVLAEALRRDGVQLQVGSAVTAAAGAPGGLTLSLADGTTVDGSHLLVAVGRRPDTDGLGLEAAGVATEPASGRVRVDATLRTSAAHIFAAGDCASPLQFTHVGDEQGRLAAANAFRRRPKEFSADVVPAVTFTEPEVARVGLTEAEAYQRYGDRARVAYVPMSGQDRARAAGETDGFVKLIAAPRGGALRARVLSRVVGMTAVAPPAGEMIGEAALAMQSGMLAARLAQTVHAYPTWSLATRIAAAQLFGVYSDRTARPARPGR